VGAREGHVHVGADRRERQRAASPLRIRDDDKAPPEAQIVAALELAGR
jgi:hypothetical protein